MDIHNINIYEYVENIYSDIYWSFEGFISDITIGGGLTV